MQRLKNAQDKVVYVIQFPEEPTGGDHSWKLTVVEAMTALAIVRHDWGPDKEDVVHKLTKRDIPVLAVTGSTGVVEPRRLPTARW